MNMVCIKSHNPHSSPYPATAAQQVTACSLSYSTSDHHVHAVLQCRICYVAPHRAEACNSLQRMTKVSNEIGLYYIDRWHITIQRACFMHISCIILKVITKSWGTNTFLVPPNQKVGGLVSPSPDGCCAYVSTQIP